MSSGVLQQRFDGKGVNMASAGLMQAEVEPWHASMRFAEVYSGPLSAFRACEAPVPPRKAGAVYVSSAAALRGAKGALMAVGLEVVAAIVALCLYGIWRY